MVVMIVFDEFADTYQAIQLVNAAVIMFLFVGDLVPYIYLGPKFPLCKGVLHQRCEYCEHLIYQDGTPCNPKDWTPDFLQEITKSYQTSSTNPVLIYMNNISMFMLFLSMKKYAYITATSSLDLHLMMRNW